MSRQKQRAFPATSCLSSQSAYFHLFKSVLLSSVSLLRSWRAHSLLVHITNHLHFGDGNQPFIHHFIKNWKQFLKVLLGVDHGHHNGSVGGPEQMRLVND